MDKLLAEILSHVLYFLSRVNKHLSGSVCSSVVIRGDAKTLVQHHRKASLLLRLLHL